MNIRIIRPSYQPEPLRMITIAGHEVQDENLLFNGTPRDKLFAIYTPFGNFCRCLGVLWSEGEHAVWDDAADAGLLDSEQVAEADADEDSIRLGNASEPFNLCDAKAIEITKAQWQADWEFCLQLGRSLEGGIETGEDI